MSEILKETLDPNGHIKVAVAEFAISRSFYSQLFSILGYGQISDKTKTAAWVTPAGFGIWIAQAQVPGYAYQFSAPGLHHLCFKAASPAKVDEVGSWAAQNSSVIFEQPRLFPEYTEKYYATFFADPDGIKLEAAYY